MANQQIVVFFVMATLASNFGAHSFTSSFSTSTRQHHLRQHQVSATDVDTLAASNTATESISLFSPCKINLFLRILRKREDGYHDLASLFQAVGFGDTLELTKLETGESDKFSCNMEGVPVDSSNLVLRALQLMREKTGNKQYFNANLIKQVPAQAGLGGGSANAATAMWGANKLMGSPASLGQVRFPFCVFVNRRNDSLPCLMENAVHVTLNPFGTPGQFVLEFSRWWNGLELWAVISLSS
jgi:hypothetical protein